MLKLLHKKCKLRGYVRGQMPKNANVIYEGSLNESQENGNNRNFEKDLAIFCI